MLIEIKCEDEKSCARLAAAFVKLGAESGQPMKVVQTPGDDPCHYIVINPPAPIKYDAGHVITVRHQGTLTDGQAADLVEQTRVSFGAVKPPKIPLAEAQAKLKKQRKKVPVHEDESYDAD